MQEKQNDDDPDVDHTLSNFYLGYTSYRHEYFRESRTGPLKRRLYKSTGIKFIVETKGIGKKLLVDAIVIQLSLGVALLKLSTLIVDFLMLYVLPSKYLCSFNMLLERNQYALEKYTKTEDFSDME